MIHYIKCQVENEAQALKIAFICQKSSDLRCIYEKQSGKIKSVKIVAIDDKLKDQVLADLKIFYNTNDLRLLVTIDSR